MKPSSTRAVSIGLVIFLAAVTVCAQEDKSPEPDPQAQPTKQVTPPISHEELVGPPAEQVRPAAPSTPLSPEALRRGIYQSIQVNVDAAGNNIPDDAANEPSIAIDPTNPARMVIGWRQFDTRMSNFRQAGWAYSHDRGQTWTFPGVLEPGVFRSDPVLATDADGNFYYYSLSGIYGNNSSELFTSTDGGVTWGDHVPAYGGDKIWMVVDNTGGVGHGHVYASWQRFYNCCDDLTFTRSVDGGNSFEFPANIPGTPSFGTIAVGPDGEVYAFGIEAVFYQNWEQFVFARCDHARDAAAYPIFSSTPVDIGGILDLAAGPNPGGLTGQAWVAVDHSYGPTRGYVYLLCSVDPPGDDPMDVMFSRSTDGGETWSAPVRINDDPADSNTWQWFGTISVAPNGRIDVIWNDTRNGMNLAWCEVFHSYSTDGGLTWSVNEPISPLFCSYMGWPQQNKLGDYYHMLSDNAGAHLAYAATYNTEQDVYYMRIPFCTDAGTVALHRVEYACETAADIAVLDCGLNSDPEAVEYITVDVGSDSDPIGEPVTLTETGPDTALFEGSISLSATDEAGAVLVGEGDTVTVTYVDADDGQGGVDVEVTGTATVDCTPPVVSNVQVTDIRTRDAVVTFEADEPVSVAVHYGPSCDALDWTATQASYHTQQAVRLTGLEGENTYYFAIDVQDQAGNAASYDDGGDCYVFTSAVIPNFFTEIFYEYPVDLDYHGIVLTPDGGPDFYSGCVRQITSLPTDPAGGTPLLLGDDEFAYIPVTGPGGGVELYGFTYYGCYVSSNGYITFDGGDASAYWHPAYHFAQARVAGLFYDLNPAAGGSVSWKQFGNRIAVTWLDVPQYDGGGSNTFQIEMFFDGSITLNYLNMDVEYGLAGLSEGLGMSFDFYPTDLSEMGACGPLGDLNCDGAVDSYDIDAFICALSPNCNYGALYPTCDRLLADCNGDGTANAYDIDAFVTLVGGG